MARMWSLLASVTIAYAGIVALVFLFQSHLVYFPNVGREIGVTPQAYGLAFEAVTIAKQRRLRTLAMRYLSEHRVRAGELRFDVAAVRTDLVDLRLGERSVLRDP